MKSPVTVSDLSRKQQLDLFLELWQLGLLVSNIRESFPPEIREAASLYVGLPSLQRLGIVQETIALETSASISEGVSENVERTANKNCRTLKFTSVGFEGE